MQLRDRAMSRGEIARTGRMSMGSVCEVLKVADERGISWADAEPLSDDEVYRPFYPGRHVRESVCAEPDMGLRPCRDGEGRGEPAPAARWVPGPLPEGGRRRDGLHQVLRRLRELGRCPQPHRASRT